MVIKARENLVGAWAFLIGIVLAVLFGFLAGAFETIRNSPFLLGIMAILGVVVGFFVAEKDIKTFLIASVSLVLVSFTGISGLVLGSAIGGINIGRIISAILQSLLALFVPATIIVALKSVFSIASN
ncbi:MAG: hypothetical protein AABW80_04520 [Nanoarchaeota archaeon]